MRSGSLCVVLRRRFYARTLDLKNYDAQKIASDEYLARSIPVDLLVFVFDSRH